MRKAADQRGTEPRLEFIKIGSINDAGDNLAAVIGGFRIRGHDRQQLFAIMGWRHRITRFGRCRYGQITDDLARQRQGVIIILGKIVGNAAQTGMGIPAAQRFGVNILAGCLFDQRRTRQKDGALLRHDNGLVRHRGHIGTACGAGPHDNRDLRNTGRAHPRLIVEYTPKMIAVRKHLVLTRQVGTATIHEIQAGKMILQRDLLRPQMLFHRQRIVATALNRGIIADDHTITSADLANAGNDPGSGYRILIEAMRGKQPDFKKVRTRIQHPGHTVTRQQFAAGQMPFA
ncbi:MAG: Uncharacterised protein [SAR116 cluster bacterium]|nr:MAG: Uncharacterised protein [SAR116 cluster bacterium]